MRLISISLIVNFLVLLNSCNNKSETIAEKENGIVVSPDEIDTTVVIPPQKDTLDKSKVVSDSGQKPIIQQVNIIQQNMDEYYWYVYPQRNNLSISSIEAVKNGNTVEALIKLNASSSVLHVNYQYDDLLPQQANNYLVKVNFGNIEEPSAQKKIVTIETILQNKKIIKSKVVLGFYPTSLYAASGLSAPNYLIVQQSDLEVQKSRVDEWILVSESETDKQFAEKTWGKKLRKYKYPYQKAQALARLIMKDLEQYKGNPSDTMAGLHPFKQYIRALNKKDAVWCANISQIFVTAANALGVPARDIHLGSNVTSMNGVDLLYAEGHSITEIYDERLKKWILMDLTLYILGASLNEVPLSAMEFYYLVNSPSLKKQIIIKEYDAKRYKVLINHLHQSKALSGITNYYNKNQKFRFLHK
jgi:hypothetical protein